MNIRTFLLMFGLMLTAGITSAQSGTLKGIVKDTESNEIMEGATVVAMQGEKMISGAYTDANGEYTITNLPAGTYNLKISYVTYDPVIIEGIELKPGAEVYQSHSIGVVAVDEEKNKVTITSKIVRNSEASILALQRKSTNVMDGISSQQFKRTGDANAASALGRVSGLSVEGGKYVYVRGLGDRYSKSMLNGSEIPGLDPNRNTVQLDIFPTPLIDNITVFKSFTPDLPGSFTGGLVNIGTKDFPEHFNLKWSSSFGVNPQASFRNDFLTYQTGKLDFLGFDDGTRALPAAAEAGRVPDLTFSDREAAMTLDQATRSFSTPVYATVGNSLLNHNHSFSIGNQWDLKGKPLGFVAGLSYRTKENYYDNGRVSRWTQTGESSDELLMLLDYKDTKASREVLWGGLFNLSFRPSPNHKLSFNFLRNQSGESSTRYLVGRLPDDDPNLIFETRVLGYQQRAMTNFQLKGDHVFEALRGMQMNWITSYTLSAQDEPDLRFFSNDYNVTGTDTNYGIQLALYPGPSRFFRTLDESNMDGRLNFTMPFKQWNALESKIKFGGAYTMKARSFRERRYEYANGSETAEYNGNPEEYFADDNMGIVQTNSLPGGGEQFLFANYLRDATQRDNNYNATQDIAAAYGMIELPLLDRLKFIGGARYEMTNIYIKNQDPEDPAGGLVSHDILPSANLIYSPTKRMNVRGSYTKTIARPTFRELAKYDSFEFIGDFSLIGNDQLKRTLIDNVDLRWEWFPSAKEVISVSGFYKHFTNPIERVISISAANRELTLQNVPEAQLFGLELEARKSLGFIHDKLTDFRVGVNMSLVKSVIDINAAELEAIRDFDPEAKSTRPMFGQSPFTVNAELGYTNDSLGINASLNFNVFGQRISFVNRGGINVYEQSRPRLDFFIAKQIKKHWSVNFRARNLINPKYNFTQNYKGEAYNFQSYRMGQTFSLGFAYQIP